MYDFCRSSCAISLMISRDRANHAIVNKEVPIRAVHSIDIPQTQELGTTCRLARGKVN
jgi:hypothetical protein